MSPSLFNMIFHSTAGVLRIKQLFLKQKSVRLHVLIASWTRFLRCRFYCCKQWKKALNQTADWKYIVRFNVSLHPGSVELEQVCRPTNSWGSVFLFENIYVPKEFIFVCKSLSPLNGSFIGLVLVCWQEDLKIVHLARKGDVEWSNECL